MKVLCAVDGSEFSNWAIESLARLFHQSLKEVVLLYVIDDVLLKQSLKKKASGAVAKIQKVLAAKKMDGEKILRASEEKVSLAINQATTKPFASVRSVLTHGHVTETIIKQAEKRKVDLVAVGSRSLSNITGYLMGSVSRKVLTHAPCSVMTIKAELPEHQQVVVSVDGSNASKRAAKFLRFHILPESLAVHVLSVVPQMLTDVAPKVLSKSHVKALMEPFQIRAKEILGHYRESFLKEGYEVTTEVRVGDPRREILECLEEKESQFGGLGL